MTDHQLCGSCWRKHQQLVCFFAHAQILNLSSDYMHNQGTHDRMEGKLADWFGLYLGNLCSLHFSCLCCLCNYAGSRKQFHCEEEISSDLHGFCDSCKSMGCQIFHKLLYYEAFVFLGWRLQRVCCSLNLQSWGQSAFCVKMKCHQVGCGG